MVSYTIVIGCIKRSISYVYSKKKIKRIRETRKQRGLSAEELAEIADLSTVYISYIENEFDIP